MNWTYTSYNTYHYYDEITGYIAGCVNVHFDSTCFAYYEDKKIGSYINLDKAKAAVEEAHYRKQTDIS